MYYFMIWKIHKQIYHNMISSEKINEFRMNILLPSRFILLEKKIWQLCEGIKRTTGISNIDHLNFKLTVIDKRIRKSGYTRLFSWFFDKIQLFNHLLFISMIFGIIKSILRDKYISNFVQSILIYHNLICFSYKWIKIQCNNTLWFNIFHIIYNEIWASCDS